MLAIYTCFIISIFFALVQGINSMSMFNKHSYFMDSNNANNDVVDMIVSKGYLPNDKYLPKTSVVKSTDNEVTYLLSKLTDQELVKLLNEHPKNDEYDLNDIVKLAFDSKFVQDRKIKPDTVAEFRPQEVYNEYESVNNINKKRFQTVSGKSKPQVAVFRLEDKQVDPFSIKPDGDANYNAVQKLSNILYSRPMETYNDEQNDDEEEKKELLFDVLTSQLKTLCCKKSKTSSKQNPNKYQTLSKYGFLPGSHSQDRKVQTNEHMFLIINDEIKTNGSDELISVDPDSLEKNSSVLLLGPITTPLTDSQLKLVMFRISSELSKPEYLPLLQQLSDGTLSGNNIKLLKSLVTGPETRRYIKPHRCNHQSKLAKIYGGPKWLICTGYLNLNTPSLYD